MSWNAKARGGYAIDSTEGRENIAEINRYLNTRGYTLEAQAGMIGNMANEGGLNPWRWQMNSTGQEVVNLSSGYGLFQYTPARDYINGAKSVNWYSPNTSIPGPSAGAEPYDGYCQLIVFADDLLGKWNVYWWADGWGTGADYQRMMQLREKYASGGYITQEIFRQVDDTSDAAFIFLTHFERPRYLNSSVRESDALKVFPMLSENTPPMPDPPGPGPGPTPGKKRKMPIYFYIKPF